MNGLFKKVREHGKLVCNGGSNWDLYYYPESKSKYNKNVFFSIAKEDNGSTDSYFGDLSHLDSLQKKYGEGWYVTKILFVEDKAQKISLVNKITEVKEDVYFDNIGKKWICSHAQYYSIEYYLAEKALLSSN